MDEVKGGDEGFSPPSEEAAGHGLHRQLCLQCGQGTFGSRRGLIQHQNKSCQARPSYVCSCTKIYFLNKTLTAYLFHALDARVLDHFNPMNTAEVTGINPKNGSRYTQVTITNVSNVFVRFNLPVLRQESTIGCRLVKQTDLSWGRSCD